MRSRCVQQTVEPDRYRLATGIIELSEADNWDDAKLEWELDRVFHSDEPGECLCGHAPIKEHCVLANRHNGNRVIVGNVCVKKFLGIDASALFQALSRIARNNGRAVNAATIEFACERGWVSDRDRRFYLDTMRKKRLSTKQTEWRRDINDRILDAATLAAEEHCQKAPNGSCIGANYTVDSRAWRSDQL